MTRPTDTSELGLERLIVRHLAGISEHPPVAPNTAQEPVSVYGPGGYVLGRASDYNRDVALDVAKLSEQLKAIPLTGATRIRIHDPQGELIADTMLLKDEIASVPAFPEVVGDRRLVRFLPQAHRPARLRARAVRSHAGWRACARRVWWARSCRVKPPSTGRIPEAIAKSG